MPTGRLKNGFTLIEMMIAITVTVVAMAIVGPPTAQVFSRISVRNAGDEVTAAHDFARAEAVRTGGLVAFQLESGVSGLEATKRSGILYVVADTSGTGVYVPIRRSRLVRGEIISDRELFCFDARGVPTSGRIGVQRNAAGRVRQIRCERHDVTIVLKASGRVDTLRLTPLGHVLR